MRGAVKNSDARRTEDLMPVKIKRNLKLVLDAFSNPDDFSNFVAALNEDREFVAAEPRDEVGRPETVAKPL